MKGSAAPDRPIERGGRGETRRDATAWPRVPLKQVCEINPRRAPYIPVGDDDTVSFVPMPAVDGDHGIIAQRLERPFREVKKGYTYFENGDVIFAKITPCMQNGKHAVCRDLLHGFGFGSTEFHVLRPGPRVRAEWVHGFLRQPELLQEAAEHFTGAVGQQRLPEDYLGELEIPLPPLAEQERIAGRLTEQLGAVERARAAAAQRLAAAEALPAALLREVFGDPPPFDASPLAPSTPTKPGWKWHRLTSLARLATGHTPSRRCPEYWNGDIPWIQLPDIRALDGRVAMDTSEHTNALGIENSAAVRLPAGTVCLSRTASVGFVTIMGREMATSQDFVNWVCGPDLDPSFLMHLFIACRKPIRDLGSGAVHHTIYFPTVEQFSVCVPDLPTQRRLAAEITQRLAAAEGVIARCREELAAIEALPASLLRDAFGGAEARE